MILPTFHLDCNINGPGVQHNTITDIVCHSIYDSTMRRNENYNLRSNNKMLMLSKPKTNAMKRSFCYAAAKVWNNRVRDTVVSQS